MAASGIVCRSKVLLLIDFNRVINLSYIIGASPCNQGSWTRRLRSCRRLHTSRGYRLTFPGDQTLKPPPQHADAAHPHRPQHQHTTPGTTQQAREIGDSALHKEGCADVTVEYFRGLPQVTVPLPSRRERCRFTLRPISNTVGDFLMMLQHEDHGIDRASISSLDGVRIASSNTIEALMEEDFQLIINDKVFIVHTPKQEKLSQEELRQLSDVRNLVNQLYEALNVEEHQLQKERQIMRELEELKVELQPIEEKCVELDNVATRRTTLLTWAGLGLMSVQFGILARLTWWEYSWDIMEPVTYFVTYGTAMAGYAYFVLTKQEYMLPDVKDRQHLLTVHKKARKLGLDLQHYNTLKENISRLEVDLKRLRDPLQIHLAPHHLQSPPQQTALQQIMGFIRQRKAPTKEL